MYKSTPASILEVSDDFSRCKITATPLSGQVLKEQEVFAVVPSSSQSQPGLSFCPPHHIPLASGSGKEAPSTNSISHGGQNKVQLAASADLGRGGFPAPVGSVLCVEPWAGEGANALTAELPLPS